MGGKRHLLGLIGISLCVVTLSAQMIGHLCIFSEELSVQVLRPFFSNWVVFLILLICRCSLYVLDVNPS